MTEYGGARRWLILAVALVLAVGAWLVSWSMLRDSAREVIKPPVTSLVTGNSLGGMINGGKVHRTSKLVVGLTASSHILSGFPVNYAGQFEVPIPAHTPSDSSVTLDLTVKNTGTIPLRHATVYISAVYPRNPSPNAANKAAGMYTHLIEMDISTSDKLNFNCGGVAVFWANPSVCQVGSAGGLMPPGSSETVSIVTSFNQVSALETTSPSISLVARATGITPNGSIIKATAHPLSLSIVPADFNNTLSIHLAFAPDKVARGQVFAITVTLINNSRTMPINDLMIEVPETPQGNPMSRPKGFPSNDCIGLTYANLVCRPGASQTLAPGASKSVEFPEVVPGPSSFDYVPGYSYIFTKQNPGVVEVVGVTPSGNGVYATATGYVNIS